jgi:hypothetical protein
VAIKKQTFEKSEGVAQITNSNPAVNVIPARATPRRWEGAYMGTKRENM